MGRETRLHAAGNRFIWAKKTACLVFTEGRCTERCVEETCLSGHRTRLCVLCVVVCMFVFCVSLVEHFNISSFCPL